MSNIAPLSIEQKEDYASSIAASQIATKYKIQSQEFNQVVAKANELIDKSNLQAESIAGISSGEGGKIYETRAAAIAVNPKPANGIVFQVSEITDAVNAGYYSFQSAQPNGILFEKPFLKKASVFTASDNDKLTTAAQVTAAFSGARYGNQLFNKADYRVDTSMSTTGALTTGQAGHAVTRDISIIPGSTQLSWTGLGTTGGYRISWFDVNNVFLNTNLSESSNFTVPVPAGAAYFRFYFKRPTDAVTVPDTFMLNFGAQLAYENFTIAYTGFNGNRIIDPEARTTAAAAKDVADSKCKLAAAFSTTNNNDAVSGKSIIDQMTFERTGIQLFNKLDYRPDVSFGTPGTLVTGQAGHATTKDIPVATGATQLSWAGLGTTGGYRIAWFNSSNTLLANNMSNSAAFTIPVPAGATYFRFYFKRPTDAVTVLDTFMLNFGAVLPYEVFKGKITSFAGFPFNPAGSSALPTISRINWQYNNGNAPVTGTSLFAQFTVVPDKDADGATVGCTGLSYNTKTNEYVVSYYSFAKAAQLWLYNRKDLVPYAPTGIINPKPTRIIDVSAYIFHIQGNVYDPESDSYWILGSAGAVSLNTERKLIRVDDEGHLLESYMLSAYDFQAGMLALSPDLKNLLIKPNDKSWVLEINKKTKALVRQATGGITTFEGLGVDYKNAKVWFGSDTGKVYKFNYATMVQETTYDYQTLPNGSNQNVEGMVIDPTDGALVICADAYLHGANQNGNCLWIYNFENGIRKKIQFPDMFSFKQGDGSVTSAGEWLSPVFDFQTHGDFVNNALEVISANATVQVQYRSSVIAPTAAVVNRANWRDVPHYSGWGNTMPSEWSVTVPNNRYMQFKLIITN